MLQRLLKISHQTQFSSESKTMIIIFSLQEIIYLSGSLLSFIEQLSDSLRTSS